MKTVKVKDEEIELEDRDAALILTIQELIGAINIMRVKSGR